VVPDDERTDEQFEVYWRELTSRPYRVGRRVRPTLRLALATRIVQPLAGGGTAEAWVRREHIGKDCDKQWEIAAFYDGPTPCIGQGAALAALNAAAAAVCATHMADCPNNCPPAYTPQAQLGSYFCYDTREFAGLLQATETWNCACTQQPN
jgi:hypothetical protein